MNFTPGGVIMCQGKFNLIIESRLNGRVGKCSAIPLGICPVTKGVLYKSSISLEGMCQAKFIMSPSVSIVTSQGIGIMYPVFRRSNIPGHRARCENLVCLFFSIFDL